MKKALVVVLIFVAGAIGVVVGRSMRPSRAIEAAQWSADHHPDLDRIVSRFDMDDYERGYVVDQLDEYVHEPIIVNWSALPEYPWNEHLTLHLKNVPVSVVLHEIFWTRDPRDRPFVYFRDDGSIFLTANGDVQEVVRIYDVGDLINRVRGKTSLARPEDALIEALDRSAQGLETLPDYMRGPQFSVLGSELIVTASPSSQKKVFEVLEALRKAPAK